MLHVFPSQPADNCLQLLAVSGHGPSAISVKAWASARRISGISTACSYEVSSQLGGNSWYLPPHQGMKNVLQNVLICRNISQGGFAFSKVPAVLNERKRDFSAYQQHLGSRNAISTSTLLGVSFPLLLPMTHLGLWYLTKTRSLARL